MSIHCIDMKIKEQLKKTVKKSGNGGAVWVPRNWLGEEIIITRLETPKSSIKEKLINFLSPHLKDISGIFLYGSYARKEEASESDIDIIVIAKNKFNISNTGKFDIDIIEFKRIENLIEKNPIFYYSIIKESKPIFNSILLEKLKKIKLNTKNFKWFIDTTKDSIKSNKELINLDKLESEYISSYSIIYSLTLRLRGVFLMKCLKNNKIFSNKLFKKWLTKYISEYEFKEIYNVYRKLRDNKKVKNVKIEIKSTETLLNLLNKEIRKW